MSSEILDVAHLLPVGDGKAGLLDGGHELTLVVSGFPGEADEASAQSTRLGRSAIGLGPAAAEARVEASCLDMTGLMMTLAEAIE